MLVGRGELLRFGVVFGGQLDAPLIESGSASFCSFFGQMISLCGVWMQITAQGWLVLRLTNSPLWLGLIAAAQSLPVLFRCCPRSPAMYCVAMRSSLAWLPQPMPLVLSALRSSSRSLAIASRV